MFIQNILYPNNEIGKDILNSNMVIHTYSTIHKPSLVSSHKNEHIKIYKHFMHPSSTKLYNLLRN